MKFIRKILIYLGILGASLLVGCGGQDTLQDRKSDGGNPKPGSVVKSDAVVYLEKKRKEIKTPKQAQELIDTLKYDHEDADINLDTGVVYNYEVDSPKITLKEGKAHCLEGALLAAHLLEDNGYDDKILVMHFNKIKFGHAVYIYQDQENGLWGAVGQSRAEYLEGREPKYITVEELVKSYNKALTGSPLEKYGKFLIYYKIDISKRYPEDWGTRDKPLVEYN